MSPRRHLEEVIVDFCGATGGEIVMEDGVKKFCRAMFRQFGGLT